MEARNHLCFIYRAADLGWEGLSSPGWHIVPANQGLQLSGFSKHEQDYLGIPLLMT